jgi:hypothetical protein
VSAVCTKSEEAYLPVCNEPVFLLDLSLAMHTLGVENKPILSLLSIESSLPRENGGGDQQMTPKLLNEAFLAKSTQSVQFRRDKESYNTVLETYKPGM